MWSVSSWYSSLFWFFSFFDWNLLNATRPLYSFEHCLKFLKSKDLQVLQVINVVYYELYFWWLFVKQKFFIINQIDTWSFHLNNSFSTRSDQKSIRARVTTIIIPHGKVGMDIWNIVICWSGYHRHPTCFHSQAIPILLERDEQLRMRGHHTVALAVSPIIFDGSYNYYVIHTHAI